MLNFGRDYHCVLVGYQAKKKPKAPVTQLDSSLCKPPGFVKPLKFDKSSSPALNKEASYGTPEHLTPSSHSKSLQGNCFGKQEDIVSLPELVLLMNDFLMEIQDLILKGR